MGQPARGSLLFFSQHLAGAGYRNGYFGKWHVEQTNRLEDFGWHEYDLSCQGMRRRAMPGTELVQRTPGYRDFLIAGVTSDEDTQTHPAFDRGIDFIRRQADSRQPVLLRSVHHRTARSVHRAAAFLRPV